MTILAQKLTLEDINACFLRLQRSMQNEKASLDGKVTNIISGSSKSNNNAYNDNALRQLIKALQDLTAEHTKSINSLTEKTKENSDKIAQLSTKLAQINFVYDPETKTITFTGADGKPRIYTLTDTTYTFSFDETTQTLSIHNDLDVVPNPNYNPADPESPQYIPDNTHDFVQQIKGTTYTFTWSGGKLTIHNNLSTEEHPIADVVIDFDGRYYTESEIDAFITSLDTRLDAIEEVIPAEATANNKLADKNWVARAISISAATFRGTFNSLADLEAYSGPKDANDFAFVKTNTGYDQYTWVPSGSSGSWTYEFSLETLAGSLSVEVDNCNHSVYLAGTTTCSGCDNITTLCGSSDIHFNPVKRQLFANNMVLDPDETCSGSWSGGLRINRGLQSGADFWNGLMLGGQRGTTWGCTEAWWLGNDYSNNNVSGNNGKLFVTYEGAATDNQRRGFFTKSGGETLWRGNVSGNIYKDAELVNWKNIDLSGLDANTIYPVIFSLRGDNSIVRIRVHNALDGAPVPSWATHSAGFSAELDMYDQPVSWGTMNARRYVKQADMAWISVDAIQVWGYSQLTNTSIGVLWLRGGAIWRAWNSADTSFSVITSTWDDGTGETVAPVTPGSQPTLYTSTGLSYDTVSNAINASRANSVIDYNDASHPISIGYRGSSLSTTNYLAAYSADGNCIKDLPVALAKNLLAPNFLELANPNTCIASYGTYWSKELFDNYITDVGYRNHQGLISQLPANPAFSCMGIYVGRNDNFVPGTSTNGTCYWFSPYGQICGTNDSICGIELVGRARGLSVNNSDLSAICNDKQVFARFDGNMTWLCGWCTTCSCATNAGVCYSCISATTNRVYAWNGTDDSEDYPLLWSQSWSANPGADVPLALTCINCKQQRPTFSPASGTLKAHRIIAHDYDSTCIGSFGYTNDTIGSYYSSIVPYVCIAESVCNQPLWVRIHFEQSRNLSGGHIHISHFQMDATINLDKAADGIAYYCGGTYGTTYFSIPPYTCNTQYLWLYFAGSWWAPRISADIPFTLCSYRSINADQEAEIALGGGWHNFTDLRNSGGSVDNATCFNGYTWAQACAIFTGSVTPSVRSDDTWYRWLGMDSNGNLVTSNGNFWFNPGKQMMAICSLTTDPIGGLSSYYEGLRLNRSCIASGDSWTSLLIGDCWGTYCGNCDGIWIGRHHTAADNQKLFFTWQCSLPQNNCGFMYFPTAGYGACWCGNVLGYATCNIGSFLGTDGMLSNSGDWHKMVTTSGVSAGQWQHVLNLNWTTADNEWTSRLYLPTNYMTACKHMYFSTNGAGCVWEVLDNGAETQNKTGGIGSGWTHTLPVSCIYSGTANSPMWIKIACIAPKANGSQDSNDVTFSWYGPGSTDSAIHVQWLPKNATCPGVYDSIQVDYSSYSASSAGKGILGIGWTCASTWNGYIDIWVKILPDTTTNSYYGSLFRNHINQNWSTLMTSTSSAPTLQCFVCLQPNNDAKAFHWFNGEIDGVVNYAVNAECSNFAFTACCATSISVPVCCITIPAGCKDNYIRLSCGTSTRGTWHIYDTSTTFDVTFDRGYSASNLCWKRGRDQINASCSSLLLGAALGFASNENAILVRVSTLSGCASTSARTFYISYEDETGPKAPPYTPNLVCCSGWNLNPHCFVTSNIRFSYDGGLYNGNVSQSSQCVCASSRMVIPVGVTSNVNGSLWIE